MISINMDISEHIDVLKSFNGYLSNIIKSYEDYNYDEDTIEQISNLITNFYNEVNRKNPEDSDSDVDIINYDPSSIDADCSEISDTESEKNENKDPEEEIDIFLKNFTEKILDDSSLKLYQNDNNHKKNLESYDSNSLMY